MNRLFNKPAVFALALLLSLMLACGSTTPEAVSTSSDATVEAGGDLPTAAATEAPLTEDASAEPIGSSADNPSPWTEKLVTPEWEIEVLEVFLGDDVMAKLEEASSFNKPHEDPTMEYALVRLRVKYVGTEAQAHIDSANIRGMDGTNEIYKRVSFIDVEVPEPRLEADLAPGDETEGWAAIQVRKGETEIFLVLWPYVSYENSTGVTSDDTPKWYIALQP